MRTGNSGPSVQTKNRKSPSSQTKGATGPTHFVQARRVHSAGHESSSPGRTTASNGLAQMFGLDVRAAILTVLVDLMLFAGDIASLGLLIPLTIVAAGVLGFIVYNIQTHWYKDDHQSALIKAMCIGLLTAIPVPLSPLIAIPGGVVGIMKAISRE